MIGAFIIGLFGSMHCVGMCGPVTMAFMGSGQSRLGFASYHLGRILTYVVIGMFLGLVGESIAFFNLQQGLTFVLGAGLILLYGIPSTRHSLERFYYQSRFYQLLKSFLSKSLSMRKRWFLSGVANGFFPCGLTYVAAAGAVALGSVSGGALFMIAFGLGTLPALISLSFAGNFLSKKLKSFIPKSVTVIAVISGLIMIMRGLLTTLPSFNQMVQSNASGLITVCGL